ncbi:MAG: RMD1 family protein [Gammaproteobacteria bacterium]|jgi:uncharacterized Rmd1/YagE family protein
MKCGAYSFSHTFDIKKVISLLSKNYEVSKLEDVIYFSVTNPCVIQETVSATNGDVFIFSYGAVVYWGITEQLEAKILATLTDCCADKLGAEDDDAFSYSYGDKAKIAADHIILPNNHIYTKLAFSYGVAQSVKLGGFENTIQGIIEITKKLPEDLAKKGKTLLSRKEIRKLMGRIFIDRDSINLHLDLLDVPNFFWDKPDLESIHEMVTTYLDQEKRVWILNQKLSVIQQLLDMLVNELHIQHSSKLEWIIIILLCIEIVFSVVSSHGFLGV